ncbi:hypothetical protein Cgig2_031664 [Carnegiea gigantea]|uniref:Uncharacterized protein n=1 Tax=Carnegiea gigantea TaxID=171969 RepID=A0A9Q1KR73_9CARY|nr:hypothetical protein Cgig2_031664 [Carnegiea gigantea]
MQRRILATSDDLEKSMGSSHQPLLDHHQVADDRDRVISDDSRLQELGYKPELSRSLSYAISLSSITIGNIEFCSDVFDNIGANGDNNTIQHGPNIRWACNYGVRMAHCWNHDYDCGLVNGRDLLCFSDFCWALFLECKALWHALGPICFMDHRLG